MDSLTKYRPGHGSINAAPTIVRVDASMPVTGQAALSRKRDWRLDERSFWARRSYSGDKRLVKPTLAQAAALTGAGNTTGVVGPPARRYREEICGLLPLVPPREMKSKTPLDLRR